MRYPTIARQSNLFRKGNDLSYELAMQALCDSEERDYFYQPIDKGIK